MPGSTYGTSSRTWRSNPAPIWPDGRSTASAPATAGRFFWGLRLDLVCTLQGLRIAFALTFALT